MTRFIKTMLALALAPCFGFVVTALANKGWEDTASGTICVIVDDSAVPQLIRNIRASGGRIVLAESNVGCWQGENYRAFWVPNGLESWTVQRMIKLGLGTAEHGHNPAGGGGYSKNRVPRSFIYAGAISPSNLADVVDEVECKLKDRLGSKFDEVMIRRTCPSDFGAPQLCWRVWVAGHLSNSSGLATSDLQNQLDGGYWFSLRLQINMVDHFNYRDNDGNELGQMFRVELATLSSKFAKFPPSRKPEGSRYQYANEFSSGVDVDSLDDLIAQRLLEDLVGTKLRCR